MQTIPRLEKELEKKEAIIKIMSFAMQIIDHDILNADNNIRGFVDLNMIENSYNKEYLEEIRKLTLRIEKIIKTARGYSNINIDERVDVDVGKTFDNTIFFFPELKKRNIEIINECHGVLVSIPSPELLINVSYVLIDNTLTNGGEKVTEIKLHCKEKSILYQDNGKGIPKHKKNKLFQKDPQKIHAMYLIKEIADVLNWKIQLGETEKGAQFIITIPEA
jgi:signal transduction histidine kinase